MIARAAEPEEYGEIYEIVDRAFRQPGLERTIIRVTTSQDPNFRKGDLRVVEVDGKIVSMVMLMRRPLRFGTATVSGAIVSPVATHSDYQKRGYCSAVMRDAVQYMKAQGFDLSILWGAPWLYPHYGYSPAMVRTELVIKPFQNGSTKQVSWASRPFTEADLEEMTRIYHGNTIARTCAEIRSPSMWEWRPGGPEVGLNVLVDRSGRVIGYYSLGTDWGRPCAHEIGVLTDEACGSILGSLIETMEERGLKELCCIIHPDHPFARYVFWQGGEIRIRSGGGAGMARILNLASLLTKIRKELERRLYYSELHSLNCTLRVSSDELCAVLSISHGQVSVGTDSSKSDYQLDVPLAYLNPLVTGCKGVRELAGNSKVRVKGGEQALRLIEVLFPVGYPSGGHLPLVWE